MNLNELDAALQAQGWARINRRSWSRPPQLISLVSGRPADPWELKTLTGTSPITREYFADARDVLAAVTPSHYCTYCDYYSRRYDGKREPGSTVYMGTRKQVMAHANVHPIGTPFDMAAPISARAPYAGEA